MNRLPCSRRQAIQWGVGALVTSFEAAASASVRTNRLGLVQYCCSRRRRFLLTQDRAGDLFSPLRFLQHCKSLNAGGAQVSLGVLTSKQARELRSFAESHSLFIEAIIRPPTATRDTRRFAAEIQTAIECGADVARTTIIPGRRYERFKRYEEFKAFADRGELMLKRAAPLLEKHRFRLAVENHKDQRLEERLALLRRIDSEYIGACLDTGNSLALLDGPYEPIRALAPYAMSVHLKDQALSFYDDGFLLADVPLGEGSLDLPRIVDMIKTVKPKVRFSLELITRDPLKVPCLTEAYYATMPRLRAESLASTLRFVRAGTSSGQQVETLSLREQMELEDRNVARSLAYAARTLKL